MPPTNDVRRRICYSQKSPRKAKKGDKVSKIQSILENETDWIPIYRNNSIDSAIFLQRIKFFSWIFGFCFNVFLLAEVLIYQLPAIILFSEAFGILLFVSIFPNLRKSTRIVHEICIDVDEIFIKARYVTPWGVIRSRYSAKDDVHLLGSGILLSSSSGKSYNKKENLIWKEKDWNTSLQIPTTNFEILDYQRAQKVFSDFDLIN
uniref:Photosystem I assembly protein Ycf4 n=1 Tax=Panagrolaimus sp. PS1159 TaxID=55785 RepID=A0AC35G282_9BILA